MHAYNTPVDKTLTVLRPDTTDKPRNRDSSGGSDTDVVPFDVVFRASSDRLEPSKVVPVDLLPDAEGANETDKPAQDGEDETRGTSDIPEQSDVQTDPETAQIAATEADDTARDPFDETVSSLPDGPDADPRPDRVDQAAPAPISVPHPAEPRRVEPAGQGQATTPERVSPTPPSQAFGATAAVASDRVGTTAQPSRMGFTSDIEDARTRGRGDASADAQQRRTLGQESGRVSVQPVAAVLLNASASPTVHGFAADPAHPRASFSSMLADGSRIDGAERGRDPEAPLGIESRSMTGSGPTSATFGALPRSDLPQNVAMQIAAAIQRGGPGMTSGFELRLSPEELGVVRLTFTQSETGVTVNIHAERAETLELLRRNIDMLAREFLDIGYESADFTFDREGSEAQNTGQSVDLDGADSTPGIGQHAPDATRPTIQISDRLDIRL